MVRTQLDYASSVCVPYKKKHIDMIENVQKRATKQIPGMKNLSYEERLRKLELPTLSYRRLRGDMIEVYKIIQGHYDPEASTILIKLMNDTEQRFSTRTNSKKVVYNRGLGADPETLLTWGLSYGAIFSIIDGTNCSPKAVLTCRSVNLVFISFSVQ